MMKHALRALLCLFAVVCFVYAQNDGRYRPATTTTRRPNYNNFGRYNANLASSRFRAGNEGRYRPANDGRYVPDAAGQYRGANDGKYRPSDAGRYGGNNAGKYVHVDNPYQHENKGGGKYVNNDGKYKPDKSRGNAGGGGGGRGTNQGQGIGTGSGTGTARVTTTTTTPKSILAKGKGFAEGYNGIRILHLYDKEERDGYHYIYETENGILADEEGHIRPLTNADGLRSEGFYEYTGDDGLLYRVDYVADDRGFVPTGAHLHKTPEHVIKLLAYLAEHAPK